MEIILGRRRRMMMMMMQPPLGRNNDGAAAAAGTQKQQPTFASRRVQQVPVELAPSCPLAKIEVCVVCQSPCQEEFLFQCQDCKLRLYCSSECRTQHATTHKQQQQQQQGTSSSCQELKRLRLAVSDAVTQLQSQSAERAAWYRRRFANDAAADHNNHGYHHYHFLQDFAGRYSEDPYARVPLQCRTQLALALAHHASLEFAVERGLKFLLQLKRDTYLASATTSTEETTSTSASTTTTNHQHHYPLDVYIASVLLKLYREDDAVGYILYWLDWRRRGASPDDLRENVLVHWETSCKQWPFPIATDSYQMDMVEKFCSFPSPNVVGGATVPIEFAVIVLVIHVRYITVYLQRAAAVTAFLRHAATAAATQTTTTTNQLYLPADTRLQILSYLVEGGYERYQTHVKHANRLMDYIEERDATLLRSPQALVLNDENENAPPNSRSSSSSWLGTFLNDYANGQPVVRTLQSMLRKRYKPRDGAT